MTEVPRESLGLVARDDVRKYSIGDREREILRARSGPPCATLVDFPQLETTLPMLKKSR